jgi:Alcohol dehydrogenase GroES-like domain
MSTDPEIVDCAAAQVQQYHPDGGINNVESLAGRELGTFCANLNAGVEEFSPTVRGFIDQDALEPILRAHAEELGARLRYRVECEALVQDGVVEAVGDGVTRVAPGDHVVTSYIPACGRCRYCSTGHQNLCDRGLYAGVGCLQDETFRFHRNG